MPIIEMHMLEGRTDEQKSDLAKSVTDAVTRSLGVSGQTVRILITEHTQKEFYVNGEARAVSAEAVPSKREAT